MKRSSILAHRGWWLEATEKNMPEALARALEAGFGIETDFRDLNGSIVVSHDPPLAIPDLKDAAWFFGQVRKSGSTGRLALNIKADGLQQGLTGLLREAGVPLDQVYAFDMAVPDALGYLAADFPVYTRISEYEETPSFLGSAKGVWVDNFTGEFPQVARARALLNEGHRVAIVSSELHGRAHHALWDDIAMAGIHLHPLFELCTDLPMQAADRFGTSQT